MHTKTAVLNRLGSLLVLARNVNSKVLQAEEWSSRSRMTVVNISANASDCLAKTAVEKAIVHKNQGRSGQYFIFMVASVAASSFLFFHAAQSLKLLRMMLPRTCVGNFGVKKFLLPDGFYEIFLTRKFIT